MLQQELIIRRIYEDVLNAGDLDVTREVIAPEAIDHTPRGLSSLPIDTADSIAAYLDELCTSFPDVQWVMDEVIVDDGAFLVRTTMHGSHHAEFRGVRALGRQFTICGVDTLRITGNKIVEHWGELDLATMRQQLDDGSVGERAKSTEPEP